MRRLVLGRIAGVFGIKGWVKLHSYTRPIENLLDYSRWCLVHQGREVEFEMVEGRIHGAGLVAQIARLGEPPIEDRDVAASWIGAEIHIDRDDMPDPEEGQYYWADLVGVTVKNEEGVELGQVDHMTSNGAQDVMVLKQVVDGISVERLIPFVKGPIIKSVDLSLSLIVADWQADY